MNEIPQARSEGTESIPTKKGTAWWKAVVAVAAIALVAGFSILVAPRIADGTLLLVPAAEAGGVDGVYTFERETTDESGETYKWLDVVTVSGRYASMSTYNRLGTEFPAVLGSFDLGASKAFWSNNTTSSLLFSRELDEVVVTGDVSGKSQSYARLGTGRAADFQGNWEPLASRLCAESSAEALQYQMDSGR